MKRIRYHAIAACCCWLLLTACAADTPRSSTGTDEATPAVVSIMTFNVQNLFDNVDDARQG